MNKRRGAFSLKGNNMSEQRQMQVTEEEARKRICPIALGSNSQFVQHCFGSECMAWRWVGKEGTKGFCGFPANFPSR